MYADDGSGWVLQVDGSGGAPQYAINKHGTKVSCSFGSCLAGGGVLVEDSNGNQLNLPANSATGTDTLGRTIYNQTPQYYDSSGTLRTIQVSTTPVAIQTNLCQFSNEEFCYEHSYTWNPISQITLPNGPTYSFSYVPNTPGQTSMGEPSSVTLPTGGQISWAYFDYDEGGRAVASRSVTPDGVNFSTWHYQPCGTDTDPLGAQTSVTCTWLNPGYREDYLVPSIGMPYATKVEYHDLPSNGGGLLKTVQTDYNSQSTPGYTGAVLPIRETTTWNQQNLVSKVETTWDSTGIWSGTFSWRNPISKSEYDWGTGGPGGLLRTTTMSYRHLENGNYLASNIADRGTTKTTYDGSGNLVAQTTSLYDTTSLATDVTSAPSHDTAVGFSTTVRGNPTETDQWVNTTSSYLRTYNTYDILGNLRTTTDPAGNVTEVHYDDSWSGATCPYAGSNTYGYLTRTVNPKSQTNQAQYFLCTGLIAGKKDQNDINAGRVGTTMTYDLVNRPTTVSYPDGGSVTFDRSDLHTTATPLWASSSTLVTSGVNTVRTILFDGVGRIKQRQSSVPSTDCSGGIVYTDSAYDLSGRPNSQSNPYCSTADTTYGITQTSYDGLGRPLVVTEADNSTIQTLYSGNATTVTDEAGNQRKSYTDALGRLIQVDEPSPIITTPATSGFGYVDVSGSEQTTTVGGSPATAGTGSVSISGSEQSNSTSGTAGTGSVTISGSERRKRDYGCYPYICYIYDSGDVSITVNGVTAWVEFGQGSTATLVASALATAINNNSSMPVTASSSSGQVNLTSKTAGANTNYPLSASYSWDTEDFAGPSFTTSPSGATLTGGTNGTTTYDSGTVSITVNGSPSSVSYGQGSTNNSIASALASALTSNSPYVTASASGNVVTLTSRTTGGNTNYSLSGSSSGAFSPVSFTTSTSGANLTGGTNATAPQTIYDAGTVQITVNGEQHSVSYGQGSTASGAASSLAGAFSSSNSVTASASGPRVSFTSKSTGASTNYSLSASSSTSQGTYFSQPSFTTAPSGSSLTGGADQYTTGGGMATPYTTLYKYDSLSNLTCVEQHGGVSGTGCAVAESQDATSPWRVRRFTYDSIGRLTRAKNPESGVTTYAYDSDATCWTTSYAGDLVKKTDARGISTCFSYDQLHRVLQRKYLNSPTNDPSTTITYDSGAAAANPIGHRTHMTDALTDALGSTTWAYDPMGRASTVSRTTTGINKSVSYSYYFSGGLKQLTYPDGSQVLYDIPSVAGRPTKVWDPNSGVIFANNLTYLAPGQLRSSSRGSVTTADFYNKRLQPCRLSVTTGAALTGCGDTNHANKLDFSYDFHLGNGDNGNVYNVTNNISSARTWSYTYDQLNRITSGGTINNTGSGYGNTYALDAWGNLLQKNPSTESHYQPLTASVNYGNHLLVGPAAYDSTGNMTTDNLGQAYTFDAENRIAIAPGVTFGYDGDGSRVRKSNGTLYWFGSGSDVLQETDLNGNTRNRFVFMNGKRIARQDFSSGAFGSPFQYFGDHLGTSRIISDQGGNVCNDADFYPYGEEANSYINTCPQNYRFTGKERDSETGLDYFGARYYGSSMGRLTSVDPSSVSIDKTNPQSWNRYTYTLNNPLRFVDTNGKWPTDINRVHDRIIDRAFPGLSPQQRQILKQVNSYLFSVTSPVSL